MSCETEISVELPRPGNRLTIEGTIELNEYPVVFLSKNLAYFDQIDTNVVNNLIVNSDKATVIVSHNNIHDTLIQKPVSRWPYNAFVGSKFKGELNSSYDLKVIYNEKIYTSTTTIGDTVGIDSVWFKTISKYDSIGFATVRWYDPITIGDSYAIYIKHVGVQDWYYRPFFSTHVHNDKATNNKPIIFYPLTRGFERNDYYNDFNDPNDTSFNFLNEIAFKIGDTVSVKLAKIDQNAFIFWNSWYRNMMSNGNPFTNPASIKSNINGEDVNGFWIGRATYICNFHITNETEVEIL